MPSWKKVITSGSDASLNSLNVTSGVTGSLLGTASYATQAVSASYALTASYATNGGVTQIIAGPNITVSPTTGVGQVTISSTSGGGGTGNTATGSYGSFYSTQTQTNVASTARSMSLNTTDITNGVSISGSTNPYNTYIKTENAGVYDIQFSAQVDKTDSGTDEIWIWIRKNGTDISDSATSVQLQGNGAHYVAAWNFFVNAAANDYFQLMWYSPDANVRLHAEAGFGVVPGIPSLIVTVNRVDQFLSNTGSFSGSFTGNLIGTASYATTASYVQTAQTASYVLNAVSASFSTTASYATQALSASYAPGGGAAFPYTGSAEITGSLGVTGSFSVLDSIDGTNKILIGSGPIPGSTEDSVNWDGRMLVDSNGNFSVRWGALRTMYDSSAVSSLDWQNRIVIDTGTKTSIDWQNRTTIDTGTKTSIDWQNRQLKDSSGNGNLNWSSGVSITGSAVVSGSLTVTGSLLITGSSTLINQGPTILSGSFKVQGEGTGFTGPFRAIEIDDANFSRNLYDLTAGSSSIDFGNRSLNSATGQPVISWDGQTGIYDTYLYNSQIIDSATRGNLYGFNVQGGQTLAESYFDTAVMDNDLVYLNPDGQWYQVDQTTNSSTKMLGIAKNVFSQTGSVFIEGDIVVSTGPGYPSVGNANYGLPVYIKQGNGIAMDTTIPASGYVRILGHCYWNAYTGSTEWIMKFRPSNEWIEL